MNFGSILRGVYHALTPWHDSGKVFSRSSYQPQKKKRPEDQAPTAQSNQNIAVNAPQQQPQLKVQRPENLFAGLNENLKPLGVPNNTLAVNPHPDLATLSPPQPGTVIKPTVHVTTAPAQSIQVGNTTVNRAPGMRTMALPDAPKPQDNRFWQKVGRGFKTAGETAVGTVANVPEVGLAAGRAASGLVQGAAHLPSLATHALTYVPRRIAGDNSAINRGLSTINRGVDTATSVVDKPFDFVNRGLDRAAQGYERIVPQAAAGAQVYRREQVPLNILAGLLTLGGSAGAEGAGQAGRVTQALNKPLTAENVVSRTGRAVSNRGTPVVQPLMAPVRSARAGVNRLIRGPNVPAIERDFVDAGEAGNVLSNSQLDELTRPPTQVPVTQTGGGSTPIPVGVPRPGAPIRELGGDTPGQVRIPTAEEAAAQKATDRFNNQPSTQPDWRVEGARPRTPERPFTLNPEATAGAQGDIVDQYATFLKDVGEGNGTQLVPDGEGGYVRTSNNYRSGDNKGKRMTKADWRAQAEADLRAGKAEPGHQKAFDDSNNPEVQSLLNKGDQTQDVPVGRPIAVKEVRGIPVQDQTVVPQNLPETPGTVRPTTQTSPTAVKTEAVANAPVVASPTALPTDVQAVLDNPRQYNKRQVAAARNQRKLAKQLAKTKADTQSIVDNSPDLAPKPEGDPGFVKSGEYIKGRRGNVTEQAHKDLEAAQGAHDTANLSHQDVLAAARQEINENGVVGPTTTRNLKALRDSGRFDKTSPEYKAINTEYENAISHHARALSMTDKTARTTSTGEQLANRFTNKLLVFAEDSGKITDSHIRQVTEAETAFTEARDAANAAGERFKATGSQADFDAWKAAQQVAEKTDRQAKITEYLVSKEVLKGNKSIEASKAVQQAEKNAGVYSMDSIDANMLSGTGTMVRNFVNTLFPRVENKLFGRLSTRIVKPIATVGGSSGRGSRIGASIGKDMFKADVAARKVGGVGIVRRTVTAGNTIGERNIQATAHSKAFDHYKQLLKKDGYSGKDLSNRAEFNVRTDPDGLVAQYEKDALQANALSSLTHTKKIENVLADGVQKALAGAGFGSKGQSAGRFGAKAVTRVGLGFPTVIAKSLAEGFKRATLGIPEAGWSTAKFLNTGNRETYAAELAKAMQHAGSGGGMILLGRELGKMGVISGAYPSDKAERERWTAEGRQENSIKIAGQWFNIPGYLGGFALPLMLGATTASGNVKDEATLKNAWSTVLASSPVDSLQSTLDIVTGNGSESKVKNAATSLARAATPAGSFLAELARMTDSTKNDTTTKDALHNILDNIAGGIPGLNNKINTIAKTDAFGNELKNPNPVATALGAQGVEQKQGGEDVKAAQSATDDTYKQLTDYGVLKDKTLMGLVDKKIQAQIAKGQKLTPEDVTKVQKAITKGITDTGEDTAYLEKGQYDTNITALKIKRDMMAADPTTKPSSLKDLDVAIKRGGVYKENKIPYDMITAYKGTTAAEWRKMGLSPDDKNYDPDVADPEMYQKLWDIDQLMTKAGVSYKKDHLDKNKYAADKPKDGKAGGRGGVRQIDTSFGTLKDSKFAPSVQQYDTIDTKSGLVPRISVVRPNIVHKITSSG